MLDAISIQHAKIQVWELSADSLGNLQKTKMVLINTTPVGMSPETLQTPWPADLDFPNQTDVYDLIYNPQETLLMHQARQTGGRAENGLGMLLHQGLLAFQRWTDKKPDIEYVSARLQQTIIKQVSK